MNVQVFILNAVVTVSINGLFVGFPGREKSSVKSCL